MARANTASDVRAIYETPFLELIYRAATVHRQNWKPGDIQKATLLSVKTGGCSEDCGYCPQSAHYKTDSPRHSLLSVNEVVENAKAAKREGSNRFCMGAAWREIKDGPEFDQIVEMVKEVNSLGMETCVTAGMLTKPQAERLKQAGLTAYNHNLDSSESFYEKIISTRTYSDRLGTLENVRQAGLSVCCGGIIGMGESVDDRCAMLATLSNFDPQPESVPINGLVAVKGTPLEGQPKFDPMDMVKMVATARILMPKSRVRLSAGRASLSREALALCYFSGANSIFSGEKLLTTPNAEKQADDELFKNLGMSL